MSLPDEFALIDRIKKTIGKPSSRVLLDIGDDAAVVKPTKGNLVATMDTLIENVHFDLAYMTPRELGHKALAVNLSDLAAMGAIPRYALVSLGLRQEFSEHLVTEIYEGMKKLAATHSVDIIGGNLSQSPLSFVVDVVALGETKSRYSRRSDAKPGDLLFVTGQVGDSAAGLNLLKKIGRYENPEFKPLFEKHLSPTPRVNEGLAIVGTGLAGAMIDISDGLAREIHHLAHQSKVGFLIDEKKLPVSKLMLKAGETLSANTRAWALFGGEDYELLFTARKSALKKLESAFARLKTPLTVIGEVTAKSKGVKIIGADGTLANLEPRGWNHFVRRRRSP